VPAKLKPKPIEDEVEFFYDIVQGSPEWRELRRGIPTAGGFDKVLAKGGLMRTGYLRRLAAEQISGYVSETYVNADMQRGLEWEPEARDWYARTRFADLTAVGHVHRTVRCPLGADFIVGASPDSQVSATKGLEIKTLRMDLQVALLDKGAVGFPVEHRHQLQGAMFVCGWNEMDLLCYSRGLPGAVFTKLRDELYIKNLRDELERFAYDLNQLIARIKAMGR
jgi:hypothetical protein